MLKELEKKYGESDSAAIVLLPSKLSNTKMSDFRSAKDYVDEISNIVIRLKNLGDPASPEQHYTYLLDGLNEMFNNIRAATAAVLHEKKADPDVEINLILKENTRRNLTRKRRVFNEGSTNKGAAIVSKDRHEPRPKYFRCGKFSHVSKYCRTNIDTNSRHNVKKK